MVTFQGAKKRFGQNFLVDEFIIAKIVAAIDPQPHDHLLEIGPGMGAITLPLLPLVAEIDAVELDKDLIPILKQKAQTEKLRIHQQDILTFQLNSITLKHSSLRVIGNLPYNISTPLLFHLFNQQELIQDMHFMLQQEVAQRLAATPGSKQYGRLTVMAQYYCDVNILIPVPPHCFRPAPKVYSSFIQLTPKKPNIAAKDVKLLDKVVKEAFSKRRKTLSNALKDVLTIEKLIALGIDPTLRPEQISLENYVKISNMI